MYNRKYTIGILRENDIPAGRRHFYHSISVAELEKLGYDMKDYSADETVYLNDESYKNFMDWQYANSEKINNMTEVESIDNTTAIENIDNTRLRR